MRPIPKVCYNILKDYQLKNMLKQHNLSIGGSRTVRFFPALTAPHCHGRVGGGS